MRSRPKERLSLLNIARGSSEGWAKLPLNLVDVKRSKPCKFMSKEPDINGEDG
jgi:hypothetical protein